MARISLSLSCMAGEGKGGEGGGEGRGAEGTRREGRGREVKGGELVTQNTCSSYAGFQLLGLGHSLGLLFCCWLHRLLLR